MILTVLSHLINFDNVIKVWPLTCFFWKRPCRIQQIYEGAGSFWRASVPQKLKNQWHYHRILLLQKFNDSWGRFLNIKNVSLQPKKKIEANFLVLDIKNVHKRETILVLPLISKLFIDTNTIFLINHIWSRTSVKKDIETIIPVTSITRGHT